jgi:hypothetical protein
MFSFLFAAANLGCESRANNRQGGRGALDAAEFAWLDGRRAPPHGPVVAQFSGVWETVNMAKRSLRILKRVGGTASLGVCEACSAQFSADPRQLGQSGVQQQFNAHKCDIAQKVAPVAKEAAKVSGK